MVWVCSWGVPNCPRCRRPSVPLVGKYINVPYSEKNQAKRLGAKWDPDKKSWYIPQGLEETAFARWMQPSLPMRAPVQKKQDANIPSWVTEEIVNVQSDWRLSEKRKPQVAPVAPEPEPVIHETSIPFDELLSFLKTDATSASEAEVVHLPQEEPEMDLLSATIAATKAA